jgi:transglutaminase-like putative cysteine protease
VTAPRVYQVRHDTRYSYASPVLLSRQLLRVTPRETAWQHCPRHAVTVTPAPAERRERDDCFGNREIHVALDAPHDALLVSAESQVSVLPHAPDLDAGSLPWEAAREALQAPADAAQLDACQYLYASPLAPVLRAAHDLAAPAFAPRRPLAEALLRLNALLHREFEFDPHATTVSTPVEDVIELRRGVCQDFAHLMIACLRAHGIAARYVSGYLLTTPPPGQPRLVGADASHAWVSAFVPDLGWVDLDPTNDLLPDTRHVTIAWGRDFGDVSPLRGVILGGGEHSVDVRVTMLPADEPLP